MNAMAGPLSKYNKTFKKLQQCLQATPLTSKPDSHRLSPTAITSDHHVLESRPVSPVTTVSMGSTSSTDDSGKYPYGSMIAQYLIRCVRS